MRATWHSAPKCRSREFTISIQASSSPVLPYCWYSVTFTLPQGFLFVLCLPIPNSVYEANYTVYVFIDPAEDFFCSAGSPFLPVFRFSPYIESGIYGQV